MKPLWASTWRELMQRQRPVQVVLPVTVRGTARTEVTLARQISAINGERVRQRNFGSTLRKVPISVQAITWSVRNPLDRKAPNAEALTIDLLSEGKHRQTVAPRNTAHELDTHPPRFTDEESIVMRAFAAGKSIKQICSELRIPQPLFCRLLRDLMEKTSTRGQAGLLHWVLSHKSPASVSARS
jgi:DNA-binding NarL/FixJ family response regulator